MPGISFLSHPRLVFCNFKTYRAEKINKEIDNCIRNVYMMYTGLYTICIRSIGKVRLGKYIYQ
uniref:Uncharacterized protein n=1 Tax=virus sp. ctpeS3 TaxID=2826815 RepID=A0A8S5R8K8_9VIRU|nr:MAG TPA: hypothetical protein [virus sp. ctpeS3]